MNIENLLNLRELALTIPQDKFDMICWRDGDDISHECNSVGCLVGHATVLDPLFVEDAHYFRSDRDNSIKFGAWSDKFFETDQPTWNFLFDSDWAFLDNTIGGAIKRIDYVLAGNNVEGFNYGDFKEGWGEHE